MKPLAPIRVFPSSRRWSRFRSSSARWLAIGGRSFLGLVAGAALLQAAAGVVLASDGGAIPVAGAASDSELQIGGGAVMIPGSVERAGPPKANLDQIRNGTAAAPISPPNWVNGNAGASQAHYNEGHSIAYRAVLTNLPLGSHFLDIEWDTRQNGKSAIDYITHFQRLSPHLFVPDHPPELVDPSLGISGLGTPTTFPIPPPATTGSPMPDQPALSFSELPPAQRLMTIYNGTITNLQYLSEGRLDSDKASTRMRISFNATASTVVLAWGGHIASQYDWGLGNSASGISGSPYHTRLISLDGASTGNQDRSLAAAAVFIPPNCTINGPATVCPGSTSSYGGPTTSGLTYSWTITGNARFAGGATSATGSPVSVVANPGCGSFTLTLTTTRTIDGGTSTCSRTVSVADATPPVIACPAETSRECPASTSPADTGLPVVTDNCPVAPIVSSSDSDVLGCGNTRTIARTWSAIDSCGHSASCTQSIAVLDRTAPSLVVPSDRTVECTDDTSPASTGQATGGDGCGGVVISFSDSVVQTCGGTRIITRRWLARDDCEHETMGDQTITVRDRTRPSLVVPTDTRVECTGDTSPASTGQATGSDTCGSVTITHSDSVVRGCGDTATITRAWTATDACGNQTTANQIITVGDATSPALTLPAAATVECTGDTSPASTGQATGSDTCGSVTITHSDSVVPGCGDTATITRTWTATDACDNATTGVQVITVGDETSPALTLPANATIECTEDTSPASTGQATGSDTCGNVMITHSDSVLPGCGDTVTITRTWTATDDCDNATTGVQVIAVGDDTSPTLTLPAEASVECTGDTSPASTGQATGSDTCGNVTISHSDSVLPGCGDTVTITRTWTATDDCDNATTGVQVVAVGDDTSPSLTLPANATVECTEDTSPASTGRATGSDTCGEVTISHRDSRTGGCGDSETIIRTWTVTDACDNERSGHQIISVLDRTAPSITCPADREVDCDGDTSPSSTGAAAGGDTCGAVTFTFSDSGSPSCGSFTRIWTATDDCSNRTSCEQTIRIGSLPSSAGSSGSSREIAELLRFGDLIVGVPGARSLTVPGGKKAEASAECLGAALTLQGPAGALPDLGNLTLNPQTCDTALTSRTRNKATFENTLLTQALSLRLGMRRQSDVSLGQAELSPVFCTQALLSGPDGRLGTADDELDLSSAHMQLRVPEAVLSLLGDGATVADLLDLADRALAGLEVGGVALADVAAALDAINRGFDGRRLPVSCPVPVH